MTSDAGLHVALAELLADYFARVDRIVDLPAADTFAPDGRMRLGPLVRGGRDDVADYFRSRRAEEQASGRKTRHLMGNLVVEHAAGDHATVRLQCLVFAAVGEFPLPSAAPATIADFGADCVRIEDTWLIAELRGRTTFSGANAAPFAR